MPRRFLFILLLCSYTVATAQDTLHVYFTGALNGVVKSEMPRLQGDILRVEAAMKEHLTTSKRSAGEVLLFDTGDALSDHYLSHLDSGRTVFQHMIQAGYDGLTISARDLRYGRKHLEALQNREGAFPFLSSNIYGNDTAQLFQPYLIYQVKGWTVGVVGVEERTSADQVVQGRPDQLVVTDPAETLRRVIASIKDSCDLIVAVNNLTIDQNLDLAREVPDIDLLLGKYSDDSLRYLTVYDERNRPRTYVLSAPANALAIGHLEVVANGEKEIRVRPSIPASSRSYEDIPMMDYELLNAAFEGYIRYKYDGATPDQPVLPAEDNLREDLMTFALFSMLKATRSELALLNYGALVSPLFKAQKDSLTIRDIASLTRPDDPLVTLRLKGKAIKEILKRSRQFDADSNKRLRFMAVGDYDQDDSSLEPHRLEIIDEQIYAVVTTRYLAGGGDGYKTFNDATHRRDRFVGDLRLLASPEPIGQPVPLSDLLIRYFLSDHHPELEEEQAFFEQDEFLNKPLLLVNFQNVDFSYKTVRVRNNEDFATAADKRVSASTQDATNITASGYLGLVRRTRTTRWENGALFRYGLQRIGDSETQESDDRLELQTILDWENPFGRVNGDGSLNLYGSLRYDTEFTAPEDAEGARLPRRKDGYLYLGVSQFGKDHREVRFAFFTKKDFVNNDEDVGFELNVKYFKSFPWFDHGSLLRGRFHFEQPGRMPGDERALLDYTGYLAFDIVKFISLKPQVNVFLFQDMVLKEWASNVQFSISLSFSRLWKPQYIRFWRKDK